MKGDEEFNVYKEENREELTEADEIDPKEEGFMKGYEEDTNPSECALCGKTLSREGEIVERVIKEETYMFCCEEHASKFELQKEHI
jgi:hypothetical protein